MKSGVKRWLRRLGRLCQLLCHRKQPWNLGTFWFREDPQWHFSKHNWVKNKHTAAGISYFSAAENHESVTLVLQYDLVSLDPFHSWCYPPVRFRHRQNTGKSPGLKNTSLVQTSTKSEINCSKAHVWYICVVIILSQGCQPRIPEKSQIPFHLFSTGSLLLRQMAK